MIEETINQLCEKFHTTMDNLIPVYAKYMIMKYTLTILICIFFTIVCILISIYIRNGFKTQKYDEYDVLPWVGGVIAAIIGISCIIVLLGAIYNLVLWNCYPELRFLDTVLQIGD